MFYFSQISYFTNYVLFSFNYFDFLGAEINICCYIYRIREVENLFISIFHPFISLSLINIFTINNINIFIFIIIDIIIDVIIIFITSVLISISVITFHLIHNPLILVKFVSRFSFHLNILKTV